MLIQCFRYGRYTGTTLEIEKLRPKSPSKKGQQLDEFTG